MIEPPDGNCCIRHEEPGCYLPAPLAVGAGFIGNACENCVCEVIPSCCTDEWDDLCEMVANNECAPQCGCGEPTPEVTPTPSPDTDQDGYPDPYPHPNLHADGDSNLY